MARLPLVVAAWAAAVLVGCKGPRGAAGAGPPGRRAASSRRVRPVKGQGIGSRFPAEAARPGRPARRSTVLGDMLQGKEPARPARAAGAPPPRKVALIRGTLRKAHPALKLCYEAHGLAHNPRLQGLVRVAFAVGPSGLVLSARVVESTIQQPKMIQCILEVIRGLHFPKGVGPAKVRYPFVFRSGGP